MKPLLPRTAQLMYITWYTGGNTENDAVNVNKTRHAFPSTSQRSSKEKSPGNQMFSLPPGMKSRNPGTKKIALETPVRTVSLVHQWRHRHLH